MSADFMTAVVAITVSMIVAGVISLLFGFRPASGSISPSLPPVAKHIMVAAAVVVALAVGVIGGLLFLLVLVEWLN